jgi:hypothetical protein
MENLSFSRDIYYVKALYYSKLLGLARRFQQQFWGTYDFEWLLLSRVNVVAFMPSRWYILVQKVYRTAVLNTPGQIFASPPLQSTSGYSEIPVEKVHSYPKQNMIQKKTTDDVNTHATVTTTFNSSKWREEHTKKESDHSDDAYCWWVFWWCRQTCRSVIKVSR